MRWREPYKAKIIPLSCTNLLLWTSEQTLFVLRLDSLAHCFLYVHPDVEQVLKGERLGKLNPKHNEKTSLDFAGLGIIMFLCSHELRNAYWVNNLQNPNATSSSHTLVPFITSCFYALSFENITSEQLSSLKKEKSNLLDKKIGVSSSGIALMFNLGRHPSTANFTQLWQL